MGTAPNRGQEPRTSPVSISSPTFVLRQRGNREDVASLEAEASSGRQPSPTYRCARPDRRGGERWGGPQAGELARRIEAELDSCARPPAALSYKHRLEGSMADGLGDTSGGLVARRWINVFVARSDVSVASRSRRWSGGPIPTFLSSLSGRAEAGEMARLLFAKGGSGLFVRGHYGCTAPGTLAPAPGRASSGVAGPERREELYDSASVSRSRNSSRTGL